MFYAINSTEHITIEQQFSKYLSNVSTDRAKFINLEHYVDGSI